MYTTKEIEVINFLEDLVCKRFNLQSLTDEINKKFNTNIKIELKTDYPDEEPECADFNLLGTLEIDDMLCDFDIYYLPMRREGFDGATFYITEVGYEFQ